jgi:tetratricopeptide (TPR) repeat protein
MAKLRLLQKRPGEAEKLFQQALLHDPNSTDALNGLVVIELQQKQPSKALDAVREQIVKSPNNGGLYLLLGQLMLNAKDAGAAETATQKAVDLNPNNVDAFLLLAQLLVRRGAVDRAAADYQQAIQKNPRDVRLHLGLGTLEENRGNWQQAQKLYQQAVQIKPDDPFVANNLAFLLIDHGGGTRTSRYRWRRPPGGVCQMLGTRPTRSGGHTTFRVHSRRRSKYFRRPSRNHRKIPPITITLAWPIRRAAITLTPRSSLKARWDCTRRPRRPT